MKLLKMLVLLSLFSIGGEAQADRYVGPKCGASKLYTRTLVKTFKSSTYFYCLNKVADLVDVSNTITMFTGDKVYRIITSTSVFYEAVDVDSKGNEEIKASCEVVRM